MDIRKGWLLLAALLVLLLPAGCGKEEGRTDYYIVEPQGEETVFPAVKNSGTFRLLAAQFYQGEAVQLLGEVEGDAMKVSLRRPDGSEETLLPSAGREYLHGKWFLDSGGSCYCISGSGLIRFDGEGAELYRREQEDILGYLDICGDQKGGLLLLALTEGSVVRLEGHDPETGELTGKKDLYGQSSRGTFLGQAETGVCLLDEAGIWEADLEKGKGACLLSFGGASYQPGEDVSDVRLEEGEAGILRGGKLERLLPVNIGAERTVLTMRSGAAPWLKPILSEAVVRFNKENQTYYVVTEEGGSREELQEQTEMEIAMGKGPDILMTCVVDPVSLMEKGGLEDLAPWMEASGIREEDYFPATFDCWRKGDAVYGAYVLLYPGHGIWVDEALSPEGVPDLEALVDALYRYQGDAVLGREAGSNPWDPKTILKVLLSASDSCGGTIDWEKGTCSFQGGLFQRLLQTAERYGRGGDENSAVLAGHVYYAVYDYANIFGSEEQMAGLGRRLADGLFDGGNRVGNETWDGCLAAVSAASLHKEGAWEFISFLLGEEEQGRASWLKGVYHYPVNRRAFETVVETEMTEGGPVVFRTDADGNIVGSSYRFNPSLLPEDMQDLPWTEYNKYLGLTEEKAGRLRDMLENTRALPVRTAPLLEIICEEAESYFAGDRSLEEVCGLIQNRVQLYLDEHR